MPSDSKISHAFGFKKAATAFEEFINSQAFGGLVLIVCTVIALILANAPIAEHYLAANHSVFGFYFNGLKFEKTVQHWVNDGLMTFFFLLVGLEIKREMLMGELSSLDKASLPIFAAIGGMVIPAGIFYLINMHDPLTLRGWAIPMATDIAYAIGIASLLSKRVPKGLLVILSAIAIADDLGAVTVIAAFYTNHISIYYLLISALLFMILIAFNRGGVKELMPYLVVGILMWYTVLESGIHATIAGVLLAFTIPGKLEYQPISVFGKVSKLIKRFEKLAHPNDMQRSDHKQILNDMDRLTHAVSTPLRKLEHILNTPVTLLVIPIFALLNAGVQFNNLSMHTLLSNPLIIGIVVGLVLGKLLGIFGVIYLLVAFKVTTLPKNIGMRHIFGVSLISGIGFTMSIFITELAFPGQQVYLQDAKVGILIGSIIAAVFGFIYLRFMRR